MTICCSGESSALFLNSKSPIARDNARLPLTRPKSTKPPAAQIRAFSPLNCKLKSWMPGRCSMNLHFEACGRKTMVLLVPSHQVRTVSHQRCPTKKKSKFELKLLRGVCDLPHKLLIWRLAQQTQCIQILLLHISGLGSPLALDSAGKAAFSTIQYRSIRCQESIFKRLLKFPGFESFLFCKNFM